MSLSVRERVPPQQHLWEPDDSIDGRVSREEATLDRPSLQLQDVEGRIHKYEGLLSRKTKKAKLKSGWKKRWFRVIPGKRLKTKKNGYSMQLARILSPIKIAPVPVAS